MKRNNWRFEALARARMVRQDSCQKQDCLYYDKKVGNSCSIPKNLITIGDCIYYITKIE